MVLFSEDLYCFLDDESSEVVQLEFGVKKNKVSFLNYRIYTCSVTEYLFGLFCQTNTLLGVILPVVAQL